MKKLSLIILALCLTALSCTKKGGNTPNPDTQIQTVAQSIGFQFEHQYLMEDWYVNPGATGSITFHTNGTITEKSISYDTTYSAIFIPSSNNITSLFENGNAIKVFVPGAIPSTKYTPNEGMFFTHALATQYAKDTMIISTFESGGAVYNNQPQLAIEGFAINSAPYYFWLK